MQILFQISPWCPSPSPLPPLSHLWQHPSVENEALGSYLALIRVRIVPTWSRDLCRSKENTPFRNGRVELFISVEPWIQMYTHTHTYIQSNFYTHISSTTLKPKIDQAWSSGQLSQRTLHMYICTHYANIRIESESRDILDSYAQTYF